MSENKSVTMSVRMDKELLLKFRNHCRLDLKTDPNDLIRDMMTAVIDNRIKMKLPEKVGAIYES